MSDNFRLVRLGLNKSNEHEIDLTCLFIDNESGWILTADKEGLVKVWTDSKELIAELQFPENVSSVKFLNSDKDILVGHQTRISLVKAHSYLKQADFD